MATNENMEKIVEDIELNYNNNELQRITGEQHFLNHLPDNIAVLMNGDKDHDVCAGNVRNMYMLASQNIIDRDEFYAKLCTLRDNLAIEFEKLSK